MSRMSRKTIYTCDACGHKYYDPGTENEDSGSIVDVSIEGTYHDESIGLRTWNDQFQLCQSCWKKLNSFLINDLGIKVK